MTVNVRVDLDAEFSLPQVRSAAVLIVQFFNRLSVANDLLSREKQKELMANPALERMIGKLQDALREYDART